MLRPNRSCWGKAGMICSFSRDFCREPPPSPGGESFAFILHLASKRGRKQPQNLYDSPSTTWANELAENRTNVAGVSVQFCSHIFTGGEKLQLSLERATMYSAPGTFPARGVRKLSWIPLQLPAVI